MYSEQITTQTQRVMVGPCVTTVRMVGEKVAHLLPCLWGRSLPHLVQHHIPTLQCLPSDFLSRRAHTVPPQNPGIWTASTKWCHAMVPLMKHPLGQLLNVDSTSKMYERPSKRGASSYGIRDMHPTHLHQQHSYQIRHSPPLCWTLTSRQRTTWLCCSIPHGF